LIALANAVNKSDAGFVNSLLYAAAPSPFRDITSGNNGSFQAGQGWDACSGLGSPNGAAVITALADAATSRG
jgi:kumamolisin